MSSLVVLDKPVLGFGLLHRGLALIDVLLPRTLFHEFETLLGLREPVISHALGSEHLIELLVAHSAGMRLA